MRLTLCLAVAVVATMVLLGWATDIDPLKSVLPGLTTMKANTAVGLLAVALGLVSLDATTPRFATAAGGFAAAAGAVAAALGLATLAEYAGGLDLGIDELLVADPDSTSLPFNGRMSPITATGLIGLGAAAAALGRGARHLAPIAHAAALPALALGALSLTGYAYGVEGLYNFGPYVSVAVNTAVGLCALALAVVLARADEGWRRPFADRPAARAALAWLLPWAVMIPFAAGLLVLEGARAGIYQPLFAPALLAVVTACAFVAFSFMAAASARRIEAQQEILNHELSHRMKNMLAMVQSIAAQTMRTATDLDTAGDVLAGRLIALGKSHDLLLGGGVGSTTLEVLAAAALELHRDRPDRFMIVGPPVEVGERAALSLSLILHELATNATKYGALSTAAGQVAIDWRITRGADSPSVVLRWQEADGPPVTSPTRAGSGTRLIERGLAGSFGGAVDLAYPPTGAVCTITAPLDGLRAEDPGSLT